MVMKIVDWLQSLRIFLVDRHIKKLNKKIKKLNNKSTYYQDKAARTRCAAIDCDQNRNKVSSFRSNMK